MAKKKKATRRKKTAPNSVGLTAGEVRATDDPRVRELTARVDDDGGVVLGAYSDPFGGTPVLLVALPIDAVEPTPYQRDPSEPHVKRLMTVIEKVGRFLDPLVIVRHDDRYWTPNGNHRLQAMRKLGAKTITGLLVPESDVAFKILALNTEKAHNVKEKSLETIRMARALAEQKAGRESDYAFEFEEAPYLTLGAAYEQRRSLGGGAYHSVLRRIDDFLDDPLPKAVRERERRATKLLKLDDAVSNVVAALKERGLTSPYLKPFVIARVNPDPLLEGDRVRFRRGHGQDDCRGQPLQRRPCAAGRRGQDRGRPAGRKLTCPAASTGHDDGGASCGDGEQIMAKMKAYASFDDYLENQSAKNQDIIRALRKFVRRVEPGLREAVKWGNGCWIGRNGPVAYVHSDTGYVQFGFFNGSSLKDPKGLLEGKGRYVRHTKVHDPSGIDRRAFATLLRQAANSFS